MTPLTRTPTRPAEDVARMARESMVKLDWTAFDQAAREKQEIDARTRRRVARIRSGTLWGRLKLVFGR